MRESVVGIVVGCGLALTTMGRPILQPVPEFTPLRTLYVHTAGSDSHDGLSPEQGLQTIGAAARQAQPGDLILVRGGCYPESVVFRTPGTAEHPIVLRAQPGETVLISGAITPEQWEPVADSLGCFATAMNFKPHYVSDQRYLIRYVEVPDMKMLAEMPASFLYNTNTLSLLIHSSRGLLPAQVTPFVIGAAAEYGSKPAKPLNRDAYAKGIWLFAPHTRVEGVQIACHPIGVQLRADAAAAWGVTTYGCVLMGISLYSGSGGIVANSSSYGNEGIGLYAGAHARQPRIAGNTVWGNTPRGPFIYPSDGGIAMQLSLYGATRDPVVDGNLVVSRIDPLERTSRLWRFKEVEGVITANHNVMVGDSAWVDWADRGVFNHNTVVGGKLKERLSNVVIDPTSAAAVNSEADHNLYLDQAETGGFGDPQRWDFRLHEGSPQLGKGAWSQPALIRYVAPTGSNSAAGITPDQAWQTLSHAAKTIQPGTTVYVMPGIYPESVVIDVSGTSDAPVEFLTYEGGKVVIDGGNKLEVGIQLQQTKWLHLDGFIVQGFTRSGMVLRDTESVTLRKLVFDQLATGITVTGGQNIKVENVTFYQCPLGMAVTGVKEQWILRNNLYYHGTGQLVRFDTESASRLVSECNGWAGPGAESQLHEWQSQVSEAHLSKLVDTRLELPDYTLPSFSSWSYAGIGNTFIGACGEAPDTSEIKVAEFEVVYTGLQRARVEWFTPYDYADATLTWSTENFSRKLQVNQHSSHSSLRQTRISRLLLGLQPGKTYKLELELRTPEGRRGSVTTEFATPTETRAPATLYVSPAGNDENSGVSRESAKATINSGLLAAVPGDTILVAPGTYRETVTLTCGGIDAEHPLILRSEVPGKAIIEQAGFRPNSILVYNINHLVIDGFRFEGMLYRSGLQQSAIVVCSSKDIHIQNSLFGGKHNSEYGVSSPLIGGYANQGLYIRNNLFQRGFDNILLETTDDLHIDHNTFYKGGVSAINISNKLDARMRITNNIFYDVVVPDKVNPAIFIYRPSDKLVLANNLYWRDKAIKMGVLLITRDRNNVKAALEDRAVTVEEVRQRYGVGENDCIGDPLFIDVTKGDFRLQPGSPAQGMAEGQRNAGMLTPPASMER